MTVSLTPGLFQRSLLQLTGAVFFLALVYSSSAHAQDDYGETYDPNAAIEEDSGGGDVETLWDDVGKIQNEEILIIQRKFFPKKGRHEITAGILGGVPFDTFMLSLAGGVAYAYHFQQNWGIEPFHLYYMRHFDTAFTTALFKQQQSPEIIRPILLLSSSFFYSPLYGKAAIAQDQIYHADMYLLAGPAVSISQESKTFGGVVGIGVRIFANRWMTVKFEFRDYVYLEKKFDFSGATPVTTGNTLTNVFIISLGWSIYFPKFQYNPLE